jgi:hypothetical protein
MKRLQPCWTNVLPKLFTSIKKRYKGFTGLPITVAQILPDFFDHLRVAMIVSDNESFAGTIVTH